MPPCPPPPPPNETLPSMHNDHSLLAIQRLTSAEKVYMNVHRNAETHLGAIVVHVKLDFGWQMMGRGAMVSHNFFLLFNAFKVSFNKSDINECQENTDGCNHHCSNTIGSYACSCRPGFRLAPDMLTCSGN